MKITQSFAHEAVQGFKFGSSPLGKPKLFSHIYFVDGLLVDTGHPNMRKAVMETVGELPVEQLFITHHHEDHTGNLLQFQGHFGLAGQASSKCLEVMQKPPAISPAQRMIWGDRPPNFELEIVGNEVRTHKHTFQVIPVPGHAVDMLCLHEASQGWLFSADLWVSDYIVYFMRSESMKGQIESLRKVLELDFEILFCGHNPQFKEGKQRIRNKLVFFEDFYGKAARYYQEGHSARGIMKAMGLKERWGTWLLSLGELSTVNMVKAVMRDEGKSKRSSV